MKSGDTPPKAWDPRLLDDRGLHFEPVVIDKVQVDPAYQRPLREAKISRMLAEFDSAELTAIVVSRRPDGSLWALDGQHRLELLRRLGKKVVLADIREGLSLEQEARLFYRLNEGQTQVGAWDKFRARITAKEPRALRIQAIVEKHGYHLTHASKEHNGIQAVSALESVFNWGRLDKTLSVLSTVWPNDAAAREATVLLGTGLFLLTFDAHEGYDEGRILVALDKVPPSEVLRKARDYAVDTGRTGYQGQLVAVVLRDAYNGRLSRGSKPRKQLTGAIVAVRTGVRPPDTQVG